MGGDRIDDHWWFADGDEWFERIPDVCKSASTGAHTCLKSLLKKTDEQASVATTRQELRSVSHPFAIKIANPQ